MCCYIYIYVYIYIYIHIYFFILLIAPYIILLRQGESAKATDVVSHKATGITKRKLIVFSTKLTTKPIGDYTLNDVKISNVKNMMKKR